MDQLNPCKPVVTQKWDDRPKDVFKYFGYRNVTIWVMRVPNHPLPRSVVTYGNL